MLNINEIIKLDIDAYKIINQDKELIDFIPIKFESITNKEKNDSFNGALKDYYSKFELVVDKREKLLSLELKKLENRFKKQEEQKEKILTDYEKFNGFGNKIYENYAVIEELLNTINKAAKDKGWIEVKKILKENKDNEILKKIKTLNYKNNEIILNL